MDLNNELKKLQQEKLAIQQELMQATEHVETLKEEDENLRQQMRTAALKFQQDIKVPPIYLLLAFAEFFIEWSI